ncbi:MAG: hypothetical protein EOP45_14630 [Sphingobacteriaceae bacterium]|nr:MAG: hypothetical protein EOP45_14630 [Sphingobacteriaceae bacterium]
MTSERYLDEDLSQYPQEKHSGNGRHSFADVERIRVDVQEESGVKSLLREAYQHLHLPIAVTECHLHCTRDEQMRWFNQMWQIVHELKEEGIDIRAITAWALFGTYGWDKLMLEPGGTYETGAFKVTNGYPQPTAFAKMLQALTAGKTFQHPSLLNKGWWQRNIRFSYGHPEALSIVDTKLGLKGKPILIVGEEGVLSEGFQHICYERNLPFVFIATDNIASTQKAKALLQRHNPWTVITITGYNKKSGAKEEQESTKLLTTLASACLEMGIPFTRFSPEPTTKEAGKLLYASDNQFSSLRICEAQETVTEKQILSINPHALLIRTGHLFSPWDENGRFNRAIEHLQQQEQVMVDSNCYTSFAYVPDVVHIGLDWMMDEETGVFSMNNAYHVSETYIVTQLARLLQNDMQLVVEEFQKRNPQHSVQLLPFAKRIKLPHLENALQRYAETVLELSREINAVSI